MYQLFVDAVPLPAPPDRYRILIMEDPQTFINEYEALSIRTAEAYAEMVARQGDRKPTDGELAGAMRRGLVRVEGSAGDVCDMPQTPDGLVRWAEDLRNSVPAEQRSKACIEWRDGDYDASWSVAYDRPETDEEWATRKADVERRAALAAARRAEAERVEYERLKAKFA